MTNYWVKKNGQAELRENLRNAMRESGRSQRDIINEAGVGYSHVVGGMNNNNWISVEAVEAVAAVLEVSPDELLGESIYKHERDRYAEYDHPSPEEQARRDKEAAVRAEAAGGEDRTRALCCTCGALRSASWAGWEYKPRWDSYNHGRRLVSLRCVQCETDTEHAVILPDSDDDRDAAERFDHAPTREHEARQERDALIARLATFGVDVHFRQRSEKSRSRGFLSYYCFDKAKSRWRLEVDPNTPARVQVAALNGMWDSIANDDHGVQWDPRDGVMTRYGDETWGAAADGLLDDVRRFLDVERRRMVRDVRDAAVRADLDAGHLNNEQADR